MKRTTIIFGIMTYLGKFSTSTAEECEPLRNLMLINSERTWNNKFQNFQKGQNQSPNMLLWHSTT